MSAQIIQFPRVMPAERPSFADWLTERAGARKIYRVRRRTKTFHGCPWPVGTVLLLGREWDALEREYEAKYGPMYPWRK